MPDVLAILPLRGACSSRTRSCRWRPAARLRPLIEEAVQGSRLIGAVMQRDRRRTPRARTCTVGTVIGDPQGAQAAGRHPAARGAGPEPRPDRGDRQEAPFLAARIERSPTRRRRRRPRGEALARSVTSLFQKVVALSPTCPTSWRRRHAPKGRGDAGRPHRRARCRRSRRAQAGAAGDDRRARRLQKLAPRSPRKPRSSSSARRSSPRSSRRCRRRSASTTCASS